MSSANGFRPEVLRFAGLMEARLRENDHKTGWADEKPSALMRRLMEEAGELAEALMASNAEHNLGIEIDVQAACEAADVANFAMMIADVLGALVD